VICPWNPDSRSVESNNSWWQLEFTALGFRRGRPTAFICVVDMNDLSFLMPFLNKLTILLCMCDFTCCTDPQPPRICRRAFVYEYLSARFCLRVIACALLSARNYPARLCLWTHFDPLNGCCKPSDQGSVRKINLAQFLLIMYFGASWGGDAIAPFAPLPTPVPCRPRILRFEHKALDIFF